MTRDQQFIDEVLSHIPPGRQREQIGMDLRAHLIERVEHGQSIEDAIRGFGDPAELAESYLSSVPLRAADFAERTVAKIVDFIVVGVVACALLFLSWLMVGPSGVSFFPGVREYWGPALIAITVLVGVFFCPGYFVISEYLTGQTLGKRLLGLRVVRESGARITLGQSLVRQIPLAASILVLDALFALFTEKSQRAFELISKTRVVHVDGAAA